MVRDGRRGRMVRDGRRGRARDGDLHLTRLGADADADDGWRSPRRRLAAATRVRATRVRATQVRATQVRTARSSAHGATCGATHCGEHGGEHGGTCRIAARVGGSAPSGRRRHARHTARAAAACGGSRR